MPQDLDSRLDEFPIRKGRQLKCCRLFVFDSALGLMCYYFLAEFLSIPITLPVLTMKTFYVELTAEG